MNEISELRPDLTLISEWINPNSHVLDLGCGDGRFLAHLRETRNVTGYGVEIDDDKIEACISAGINVIHTDLNQGLQDFNNNSFDYVVVSQTLQAIRRPDSLLEEMLRVGHEGIVTFPNFGHWACRSPLFFQGRMPVTKALPSLWYNTENIHLCTLKDFERLCRERNIVIEQRSVLDLQHRTRFLIDLIPNWYGEIALYRFRRGDKK